MSARNPVDQQPGGRPGQSPRSTIGRPWSSLRKHLLHQIREISLDFVPLKLPCPRQPIGDAPGPQRLVAEQQIDLLAECVGILHRDDQGVLSVSRLLSGAPVVGHHDRDPAGHRFQGPARPKGEVTHSPPFARKCDSRCQTRQRCSRTPLGSVPFFKILPKFMGKVDFSTRTRGRQRRQSPPSLRTGATPVQWTVNGFRYSLPLQGVAVGWSPARTPTARSHGNAGRAPRRVVARRTSLQTEPG